jgi:2-isopropylmalate synthase
MTQITIYDTTLRDGTQAENFNLTVDDKIRVTLKLDELGVDYIEGGWPGANVTSTKYFQEIKKHELKHAKVAAFGSTRNFKNKPEDDPNLKGLIEAGAPVITIFGKSWGIHVLQALHIKLEENLLIIEDSLKYLKPHVEKLFYDAEHFFDGFKDDPEYALKTLDCAVAGGADALILCDTNGGTLPTEIPEILQTVTDHFSEQQIEIGIHAHNDSETAVANSLIAIAHGATQVQGTINGYGERCGNGNLTSIIPALALKMNYKFKVRENLTSLSETSRYINELANLAHNRYQPYVGASAFAHKGGIHVSAVQKNPLTYEHIAPEKVGNERRILISDQSGRSNVLHKAKQYGIDLDSKDPVVTAILKDLKSLENQGFQFEGADASFELLMRKALGTTKRYFDLKGFRVINQKTGSEKDLQAEATIRIEVGGEMVHTASLGDGPVNALDKALRKALIRFYPNLKEVWLNDYRVRVLATEHGTGARVRVLIESSDDKSQWGTVGVSTDILDASWQALVDSITYKLMKDEEN